MYSGEIRDSEIRALEDKVSGGNYGQYLRRITLKKLRSFTDRAVSFDFPVTAIVGPNGGGKTTVLGAAALVAKSVAPGTFFAKSGKYDASMQDWTIEYELIDKRSSPRLTVQRTARFKQLKWSRNTIDRNVLLFGVSRTVPATERRELIKAIGNKFVAKEVIALSDPVTREVEGILDKEMKGCNRLSIDELGRATLFAARNSDGTEYSEFHFGAGEASVIRIVSAIEDSPEGSLILIEEIENGLHPVATRRMVEYLIRVAKRKSCQVIFTTHSNDALDPLPPKAIWAAYNGDVLQGKPDIKALRTITGQVDSELAIFVEDRFAELMTITAFRHWFKAVEIQAISVHGMGGADPAIKVDEQHNVDPTATYPSVALIDGDQQDKANPAKRVFVLPGESKPESHVFDFVLQEVDRLAARLTVMMQLPIGEQERVKAVVKERARTNIDRHIIFEQIGADLDFTAGLIVTNAFLALWAEERPDEVEATLAPFADLIPTR